MKFTKMHGIGNDYIYVYTPDEPVPDPASLSIKLSDRHKGIGADGLILIGKDPDGTFTMDIYNADGSRGKMCGNGIRCVGKYLYDRGLSGGSETVEIKTLSGLRSLKLICENGVCGAATVAMGVPEFDTKKIPADPAFFENGRLTVQGKDYEVHLVSVGNPHCVVFIEDGSPLAGKDLASIPIDVIGPSFEKQPAFPESVNTEFVTVENSSTISMRVWERGSGETMACGTGACAAAVAAIRSGRIAPGNVTVKLRGGDLSIFWDGGEILMTGPAEEVFTGETYL